MGYLIAGANHTPGNWLDMGTVLAPSAAVQALKTDPSVAQGNSHGPSIARGIARAPSVSW